MGKGAIQTIRNLYKTQMRDGKTILCALCGEAIPLHARGRNKISHGGKGGLSIDHIIEKSRGGTNDSFNLQPTHLRCNWDKSNPKIPHRVVPLLNPETKKEILNKLYGDS